jgi:hypothetical protein
MIGSKLGAPLPVCIFDLLHSLRRSLMEHVTPGLLLSTHFLIAVAELLMPFGCQLESPRADLVKETLVIEHLQFRPRLSYWLLRRQIRSPQLRSNA